MTVPNFMSKEFFYQDLGWEGREGDGVQKYPDQAKIPRGRYG